MKYFMLVILFTYLSCNITEIDILTEISVFSDYEQNQMLTNDLIYGMNWRDLLKEEIADIEENELEDLDFFINTLPEKNITKIQLRFKSGKKPKHYQEIRAFILEKIELLKSVYSENRFFLTEATQLAEAHLILLDNQDYEQFFSVMSEEAKKDITKDSKKQLVEFRKNLNIDGSKRKYFLKQIWLSETEEVNKISYVEFHFSINGTDQNEIIVYEQLNNKAVLTGYHL